MGVFGRGDERVREESSRVDIVEVFLFLAFSFLF